MKWILVILILLAIAFGGFLFLQAQQHHHVTATPAQPAPPPKKQWTPDEIAKDPAGYLVWSDQQVQEQIAEHQKKLDAITARRQQIASGQQGLVDKMHDVQNFHDRLQEAYQRAEDEDRWPIRMAGRTFERSKADDLLAQTQSWLDDRKPLADQYNASLAKMDDSTATLRDDMTRLSQLREKIALDLESVRLNQGMAELDKYKQTESQLASMSKTLNQMSEEQAPTLSSATKTSHVDIDSLMK